MDAHKVLSISFWNSSQITETRKSLNHIKPNRACVICAVVFFAVDCSRLQERSASKLMVFSFMANISVKAVMTRLWGSESGVILCGQHPNRHTRFERIWTVPGPQEGQKHETWSNRAENESTQSFLVHSAICPRLPVFRHVLLGNQWVGMVWLCWPPFPSIDQ